MGETKVLWETLIPLYIAISGCGLGKGSESYFSVNLRKYPNTNTYPQAGLVSSGDPVMVRIIQ